MNNKPIFHETTRILDSEIDLLIGAFEAATQAEGEHAFWFARDLQRLFEYTQWRNFLDVINKAKTACEVSGQKIEDHFADVSKMVDVGSGAIRPIEDICCSRYA